jgi:hypothetical protein
VSGLLETMLGFIISSTVGIPFPVVDSFPVIQQLKVGKKLSTLSLLFI